MKPGPAPTPTAVLAMRGSWRAKGRTGEPRPPVEIPACPTFLTSEARKEWNRLSRLLYDMGLLSKLDRAALAVICSAWSRLCEAEAKLAELGLVVKSAQGIPIANPYLQVHAQAVRQLREFLPEFGLTPSARTRIRVSPPPETPDEMEKLLQESVSSFARRRDA